MCGKTLTVKFLHSFFAKFAHQKKSLEKTWRQFLPVFFFGKKWRQQKCQVAGGYETLMMRVSFNHFYFPSDLAHKTLGFLGVFHLFASTPKKNAHQKGGNGIVVRVPRWHSRITWSDLGTWLVLLVSLVLFHRKTLTKVIKLTTSIWVVELSWVLFMRLEQVSIFVSKNCFTTSFRKAVFISWRFIPFPSQFLGWYLGSFIATVHRRLVTLKGSLVRESYPKWPKHSG